MLFRSVSQSRYQDSYGGAGTVTISNFVYVAEEIPYSYGFGWDGNCIGKFENCELYRDGGFGGLGGVTRGYFKDCRIKNWKGASSTFNLMGEVGGYFENTDVFLGGNLGISAAEFVNCRIRLYGSDPLISSTPGTGVPTHFRKCLFVPVENGDSISVTGLVGGLLSGSALNLGVYRCKSVFTQGGTATNGEQMIVPPSLYEMVGSPLFES